MIIFEDVKMMRLFRFYEGNSSLCLATYFILFYFTFKEKLRLVISCFPSLKCDCNFY